MELQLTGKHGGTEGKIIQINGDSYFFRMEFWCVVQVDDVDLVCGGGDVDEFVDLEGGSLAPGLTSYGSSLGLEEIIIEPSTNDGDVFDPLADENLPSVLGKDTAIIRAVDDLQFKWSQNFVSILYLILCHDVLGYSYHPTCNRLAYRNRVTTAIAASSGTRSLFSLILDVLLHC